MHGREILDSGGNPTVEVDVQLEGVVLGRAAPIDDFEYTDERGEVVPWQVWRPRPPASSWTSS